MTDARANDPYYTDDWLLVRCFLEAFLPHYPNTAPDVVRALARLEAEHTTLKEALERLADVTVDEDATGVKEIAEIVRVALASAGGPDGNQA